MKTAFFVAFNRSYILPFHALLNSIIEYCPGQDVIIAYEATDIDRDCNSYIDYLKSTAVKYGNRLKFIPCTYKNIQNERYITLCKILTEYDSICLLDADMFLTFNLDVYFDISSNTDIIIGVRDFSDRLYHNKNYINKDGSTNFEISKYLSEFICCAPMWFNKRNQNYAADLASAIENDTIDNFGDMENINIKIATRGLQSKLLALPCEQFVQTRFSFMNPLTRISIKKFNPKEIHGNLSLYDTKIVTTQHAHCIKSIHGKFYNPEWVQFFKDEFDRHLRNSFGFTDCDFERSTDCASVNLKRQALESLLVGTQLFKFFLNRHLPFDNRFYYSSGERDFINLTPSI